jgi:transposase-like protein
MRTVKRRTDYEILEILKEYCETEISGKELQRKYYLSSSSQLSYWFRKFVDPKIRKSIHMKGRKLDASQLSMSEESLEQENERLRKELERERLRSDALNIMIDIAEKELGISIRKKSGAKQ